MVPGGRMRNDPWKWLDNTRAAEHPDSPPPRPLGGRAPLYTSAGLFSVAVLSFSLGLACHCSGSTGEYFIVVAMIVCLLAIILFAYAMVIWEDTGSKR